MTYISNEFRLGARSEASGLGSELLLIFGSEFGVIFLANRL